MPAVVKVCPFHVKGNSAEQVLALVVLAFMGFTVRLSVAVESQPAEFDSVAEYIPLVLKLCPFQIKGNSFAQVLAVVRLAVTGFTERLSVAMESHPPELINDTEYEPAAVYCWLFQVYGKRFWHVETIVVLADKGVTKRFNVAIESQPPELVSDTEYVPATL